MRVLVRPTLGVEVGASLIVSQLAAHHSVDAPLCLCDLALAHCVYGRDRLIDQLSGAARDAPGPRWGASVPLVTTTGAWLLSSYYLVGVEQPIVVPVLAALVMAYPQIKARLGPLKPGVIGALWAYAIVCLPTAERVPLWLYPYASCLYTAASNLADVADEGEDRANGVWTFVVRYGAPAAYAASGVLAACAIAIHHYVPTWSWGDVYNDVVACGIMSLCSYRLANATS